MKSTLLKVIFKNLYALEIKFVITLVLYYAKACNKFVGPISASLHAVNTAHFKEMPKRWRAVGNTVSDLTDPRFKPQTSRYRCKRVTA